MMKHTKHLNQEVQNVSDKIKDIAEHAIYNDESLDLPEGVDPEYFTNVI